MLRLCEEAVRGDPRAGLYFEPVSLASERERGLLVMQNDRSLSTLTFSCNLNLDTITEHNIMSFRSV